MAVSPKPLSITEVGGQRAGCFLFGSCPTLLAISTSFVSQCCPFLQLVVEGDALRAQVSGHNINTRLAVEGFFLATQDGVDDAIGVQPQGTLLHCEA